MIEIPLNSSPEQLFSIVLNEESYDCRVTLNSRLKVWTISFSRQGELILAGVPLLGGMDIFRQYNIPIENAYVVNLDNPRLDPGSDNLGTVARLFILTDAELA